MGKQYQDFPQYEINDKWFDQLLNGPLTYRAIYKPASVCPCWDDTTGGPEYHCNLCGGDGYSWSDPPVQTFTDTLYRGATIERFSKSDVRALTSVTDEYGQVYNDATLNSDKTMIDWGASEPDIGTGYTVVYTAPFQINMHAQSIRTKKQWIDRGEVRSSDLECSIPYHLEDLTTPNPAWLAVERDRFLFPDLKMRYQQRLKRGDSQRLLYQHVKSVIGAKAKVNDAIANYTYLTDFNFTNGAVNWLTAGPPAGTYYILEYVASPEYFIFDEVPQARHIAGADHPRRVGLRLFESYPERSK
jgi:hypothetical protein